MEDALTYDTLLLLSPFLIFFLLVPAVVMIFGDSPAITSIKTAVLKLFGIRS